MTCRKGHNDMLHTITLPPARDAWGFKPGERLEVLDGTRWRACILLATDADAAGRIDGAIVRTMDDRDRPRRLLYVKAARVLRRPELTEAEAFRRRERARLDAIEARQAKPRSAPATGRARD